MELYTWKDVERSLLLNRDKWVKGIVNIEVFPTEIVVTLKSLKQKNKATGILSDILGRVLDNKVFLALGNECLSIVFEEEEEVEACTPAIIPLFKKVLYQNTAYYENMVFEEFHGVPVIAFHSYKGGVGRTLSMLAFAKAWSSIAKNRRLLLVDSDIEAPGLTWLWDEKGEPSFSYLDLLEIIQTHKEADDMLSLVIDKLRNMTMRIETDMMEVEHFFLPTYRYQEQLLDMYSSPESIASSYGNRYVIAEVLSEIGKRLGAAAVLVDLRAGISEFSAPILFDPRVKKYIVTSTSYQSVKGTELLLQQMIKGLAINEETKIPEIFLTMVPEGINTVDLKSDILSVYDQEEIEDTLTDNLVTELPFASELIHLESLEQISRCLDGRDFYKKILNIVRDNYLSKDNVQKFLSYNREEIIQKIHNLSQEQINAEGNVKFSILLTQPINNLIKRYEKEVPTTVIMGAKGSGKTFLYRELLRCQYWEKFLDGLGVGNSTETDTYMVPLLAPKNAGDFDSIIKACLDNYKFLLGIEDISPSFCMDNEKEIIRFSRKEHDILDWYNFWKRLFLPDIFHNYSDLDRFLAQKGKKVVFVIDGLEEILTKTLTDGTEKNGVCALCQNIINEIRVNCKNVGFMLFLRKDLARNSVTVNFEQFNTLYKSVELNWSRKEALRLVLWLVNQAVPGFYREVIPIESASEDVIENNLVKLWGIKLGKSTSNEAYSSRWIPAALSDFNGQLQARDIIRFLQNATEETGKKIYDDRYIMPSEIKKAVPKCSMAKISEIKDEISVLRPIFEKLESAPMEKKILPFYCDTFEFSAKEELILKQEGYLRIDNDKYYLPEIIRHALKFRYEKGARPKVLSWLL